MFLNDNYAAQKVDEFNDALRRGQHRAALTHLVAAAAGGLAASKCGEMAERLARASGMDAAPRRSGSSRRR